MVLKLYGFTLATCTQRVLVVAKQLNVPIEVINVDLLAREHKSPEYLKKQPFGLVPVLVRAGLHVHRIVLIPLRIPG